MRKPVLLLTLLAGAAAVLKRRKDSRTEREVWHTATTQGATQAGPPDLR